MAESKRGLENTTCGFGQWQPACLQRLNNMKAFLFFTCLLNLAQSMAAFGYIQGIVTTLEKQFGLRSTMSGLIVSSYEIGNLLVVVFVSYFGATRHRPKWVAWGSLIMTIGCLLFTVPHFIIDNYNDPNSPGNVATAYETCNSTSYSQAEDCASEKEYTLSVVLLILANMLIGIGAAPLYTLGTTYIDDHVKNKNTGLYIGIMYSVGTVGPAFGFLLASLCLSVYVDIEQPVVSTVDNEQYLNQSDPRWIGAWWIGSLINGSLIAIFSIPMFLYPKSMRQPVILASQSNGTARLLQSNENNSTSRDKLEINRENSANYSANNSLFEDNDEAITHMNLHTGKLKDIPRSITSLFTNVTYICISLFAVMELAIATGFITFTPKFLEAYFGITASFASLMSGVLIPAAAGGTILGGYIAKKYNFTLEAALKFTVICTFLAFISYGLLYTIACKSLDIAGVTLTYEGELLEIGEEYYVAKISSGCNIDCSCSTSNYEPVCGSDGVTYFSPCFAGCEVKTETVNEYKEIISNFSNCGCISNPLNSSSSFFSASMGKCPKDCVLHLALFMIFIVIIVILTTLSQMPGLMIILRCVKKGEGPFALGMQFVLFRTLAYIPSPIYYGAAIDSSCILWESCDMSGDISGSCWENNTNQFRLIFVGLSLTLKFLALLFALLAWFTYKRNYLYFNHYNVEDSKSKKPSSKPCPKILKIHTTQDIFKIDNTLENYYKNDTINNIYCETSV